MVRKSVPSGRRGLGALMSAGVLGVLVVATASACASTSTSTGAGGTSSMPVVVSSSGAPSGAASPSTSTGAPAAASPTGGAGSSASNHPIIPGPGGIVVTPQAQLSSANGKKLTPFDSASHSKDGLTVYVGLESMGGACGQYDVVLQQSSGSVDVGLIHLSAGTRMCPDYMTHMRVAVKLSAPLNGRTLVDLANNQVVPAPAVS